VRHCGRPLLRRVRRMLGCRHTQTARQCLPNGKEMSASLARFWLAGRAFGRLSPSARTKWSVKTTGRQVVAGSIAAGRGAVREGVSERDHRSGAGRTCRPTARGMVCGRPSCLPYLPRSRRPGDRWSGGLHQPAGGATGEVGPETSGREIPTCADRSAGPHRGKRSVKVRSPNRLKISRKFVARLAISAFFRDPFVSSERKCYR
jgi:hypothetical protein